MEWAGSLDPTACQVDMRMQERAPKVLVDVELRLQMGQDRIDMFGPHR